MIDKQVIFEDYYNNKISTIKWQSSKILIEIWDENKGLVYIRIKETEDILKLRRFFESIEIEEKTE